MRHLLVDELQHRIRNLLTVVQCLVSQTDSLTAEGYRAAPSARIASLTDACNLIEQTDAQKIPLAELLSVRLGQTLNSSHDLPFRVTWYCTNLQPTLANMVRLPLRPDRSRCFGSCSPTMQAGD
ncbi:hypothetical protein IVA83_13955 [Bradyrhizobium sp. 143]|nr:hypothetical protein [Bradyrhizobium sp. 143]MCK1725647.1 hypothetical protein [Bradyrhizobium sp. 142]